MAQTTCPFLITVDQDYNQGPPVDYPSFENRCLSGAESDMLLFPHQATFCLSNGHRMCPLFKAARQSPMQTGRKTNGDSIGIDGWKPVRKARGLGSRTGRQADREIGSEHALGGKKESRLVGSGAGDAEDEADFVADDSLPQDSLLHTGSLEFSAVDAQSVTDEWLEQRRPWGWIGAAAAFVLVMFFGALVAAWVGWNFANAQLEAQPGQVSIAPSNPQPNPAVATPALGTTQQTAPYVIWTETSPANLIPPVNEVPPANNIPSAHSNAQQQNQDLNFPVAVTATPMPGEPANNEAPLIVVQPQNQGFIPASAVGQPLPDIQVEIPTRRATPTLDISIDLTQAALTDLTPTPADTPTPLGTPVVIFGADALTLKSGECTMVRWSVQNVSEVYYDNYGVNGKGEKEECLNEKDGNYILRVVLPNGAIQVYTTTVVFDAPTATPTITPTFTPEPIFTPTWTPIPPTPSATPNIRRSVSLAVQGDGAHTCAANSTCTIGLLVSNTGDQIDNLTVSKLAGDSWSALLCRNDGVCGSQVPLISVGPGNTVFLELRLTLPADAASGNRQSFQIIASSDGSGGTVTSAAVTVEVVVQ